jgi:hypothetical protein
MNSSTGRQGAWLAAALLVPLWCTATELVQDLRLQGGWNAVWLEVTPADPSPAAVFAGTPVDQVAAFFPTTTTVQFVTDPSEAPWNRPGWGVWYAPTRPEAALNSLSALDGARAYLVHALGAGQVSVRGTPVCLPLRWQANSLNFVGLPVDPEAGLTFSEFFAGSTAHLSPRVYRLVDGCWRPLSSPSTTAIVRGEAYWVYCAGRSEWQGPLEVSARGRDGIDFGTAGTTAELRLINRSSGPLVAALTRLGGDLPLCTEERDAETMALTYPALTAGRSLGQIAAGTAVLARLQVRREQMTEAAQWAVLSVRGGGCLTCIAVSASRGVP